MYESSGPVLEQRASYCTGSSQSWINQFVLRPHVFIITYRLLYSIQLSKGTDYRSMLVRPNVFGSIYQQLAISTAISLSLTAIDNYMLHLY